MLKIQFTRRASSPSFLRTKSRFQGQIELFSNPVEATIGERTDLHHRRVT